MKQAESLEYLTVRQVAEKIGVDVKTVYGWIAQRKIRSKDRSNLRGKKTANVRERKSRRVHVSEVERVISRISSGLPV